MRSPLAYRPRQRPLQLASPGAAVAYLASLSLAAFLFSDPLLLLAIGAAACIAGFLSGLAPAVRFALKIGLVLAVLLVLVNGIAVSRGETVLFRLGEWPLFGRVDVTMEALLGGATIGLRAVAVMVLGAVYSAAVDPDRVLRALRPWLGRSALTASLAARLLPVAFDDAQRLGEAARLRGPGAAPVGRGPMARRLLAGSLDRAVDVAATLELRGYGLMDRGSPGTWKRRRDRVPRLRSRFDRRFYLVAGLIAGFSIAARIGGIGGFDPYPTVEFQASLASLALAAGILLSGLAPIRSPGSWRAAG